MDGTITERVIGRRYRLESVLGRGGMGVVWAAHDVVLGRPVAVKEVLPVAGLGPDELAAMRRRTLDEARNAARLASGASVLVYDVVEEDGEPWIVMERLAPRNLDDVVRERGALATHEVAELGLSVLSALDAAHAVGVLHRDVKPSNVMFRGAEQMRNAVLTDFGVARFAGDPSATATGTLIGSPAFVSPERASGAAASAASDLWALGVTLWIATEGVSPFHREGTLQTLSAVLTADPPPLRLAGPLAPLLTGLLHKDPRQRLSAAQARHLLERVHGPRAKQRERVERTAVATEPPAAAAPMAPEAAAPAAAAAAPVAPAAAPAAAAAAPVAAGARPAAPGAAAAARRPRGRRTLVVGSLAVAAVGVAAVGVAAVAQLVGDGAPRDAAAAPLTPATTSAPARTAGTPAVSSTTSSARANAAVPGPTSTGIAQPNASATSAATPGASSSSASATGAPTTGASVPSASARPSATGSVSGSATASVSSPAAGAASSAGAGDVPAGMRRYTDRTGFSVAVPSDWTTERRGRGVYLRDPSSSAYLLVDQTDTPAPDPVADWQQQEKRVSKRLSNYRLVRIDPLRVGEWRGADWEFTHGRGTHVLNRNLITGPRQAYALYWSVPDSAWSRRLGQFEQITTSFRPRG